MVVLDTDLLSLLERDSGEAATLRRRLRGAEAGAVVTTIINFEEQMRGWLEDQILADFPSLEREDIRACLAFAATRERRLARSRAPS